MDTILRYPNTIPYLTKYELATYALQSFVYPDILKVTFNTSYTLNTNYLGMKLRNIYTKNCFAFKNLFCNIFVKNDPKRTVFTTQFMNIQYYIYIYLIFSTSQPPSHPLLLSGFFLFYVHCGICLIAAKPTNSRDLRKC